MANFQSASERQRKLLEIAFEPYDDGYVFYRNAWTGGVPVSARERELYLSMPVLGSRQAYYDRIKGRETVTPPRPYDAALTKIAQATPWFMVIVGVLTGAVVASWSTGRLALPLRVLCLFAGAMFWIYYAYVAYAKIFRATRR